MRTSLLHLQKNGFKGTFRLMAALAVFILQSFLASSASAQIRFGHLSYSAAFRAMPEYVIMQKNMQDLKTQYDNETKRAEQEFNTKYEAFLDAQRDLAPAIRSKRQAELQELMEKNIAFRAEANRLLDAARTDAEAPLRQKLSQVLAAIGQEKGYAFIINTDGDACPYIDPALGENIIDEVTRRLQSR